MRPLKPTSVVVSLPFVLFIHLKYSRIFYNVPVFFSYSSLWIHTCPFRHGKIYPTSPIRNKSSTVNLFLSFPHSILTNLLSLYIPSSRKIGLPGSSYFRGNNFRPDNTFLSVWSHSYPLSSSFPRLILPRMFDTKLNWEKGLTTPFGSFPKLVSLL